MEKRNDAMAKNSEALRFLFNSIHDTNSNGLASQQSPAPVENSAAHPRRNTKKE